MLMLLALVAGTSSIGADQRLSRMTALYEKACLKAFPNDKAVEAVMVAQNARELTADQVKATMRDDPARAWDLNDRGATLWIELPPFHACSVRWNTPYIGDLHPYRAIADRYEQASGEFHPVPAFDSDRGAIHVHYVGEQRRLSDNSTESLFIFDQQINDLKRRQAGETGVVLRFVHQFAPAAP